MNASSEDLGLSCCEVCGTTIAQGAPYCPAGDGMRLCAECAPMASDQIKEIDSCLSEGDWERSYGDYFEDEDDLRAYRDTIAARVAAGGDYKILSGGAP